MFKLWLQTFPKPNKYEENSNIAKIRNSENICKIFGNIMLRFCKFSNKVYNSKNEIKYM